MVVEIQAARHKAVTMHGCKIGESKCFILEGGRLMKRRVRVVIMIVLQQCQWNIDSSLFSCSKVCIIFCGWLFDSVECFTNWSSDRNMKSNYVPLHYIPRVLSGPCYFYSQIILILRYCTMLLLSLCA